MTDADILTLSDFRLPGGTSHSNAEEVLAQHRLGLSTELVQLNGKLSPRASALNPRIEDLLRRGLATLRPTPTSRSASTAIARHPAMILPASEQLGPVQVEHLVIVVNATPVDWLGHEHWRPEEVHVQARETFGVEPLWAPIGPLPRSAIASRLPPDRILAEDWLNIIDVDHWWVDRSGRDRTIRPVVGRHSRPSPQKWPEQPERDLIYPRDGRWDIRVLGWDQLTEARLGPPPEAWTVHPFGTMAPRDFLAGLDFFVYFHHPNLREAFGRTILEAIASGVPAILPPHFEPVFGAAAIYAHPEGVPDVIEALWADEQAYQTQVALSQSLVRHRFSYQTHGRRLKQLLGPGRVGELLPPVTEATPTVEGTVVIDLVGSPELHRRARVHLGGRTALAALTVCEAPTEPVASAWYDRLPPATPRGLPRAAWEAMAARRVETLRQAHPGADLVVLCATEVGEEVTAALAGSALTLTEEDAG